MTSRPASRQTVATSFPALYGFKLTPPYDQPWLAETPLP